MGYNLATMRIAHISDFHYTRLTANPLRLFSKRLMGHVNWLFARKHNFSEEILEPLPTLFQELGVDLVLLGGDLTTTALLEEFEVANRFVKKLKTPWIAIPGNHDTYTYNSHRNRHFYRYFTNKRPSISHPVDFFTLKDHQIEAYRLFDGTWLVALDVSRATNLYSSRGLFSEKQEERLIEILSLIPATDSILLLCHYPFFQNDQWRRNLERGDALQALLENEPRIRLFLHGHTHRRTMADLQPSGLPIVLDSGSCAQLGRASWNLIDINSSGCKVDVYRWLDKWNCIEEQEFTWKR